MPECLHTLWTRDRDVCVGRRRHAAKQLRVRLLARGTEYGTAAIRPRLRDTARRGNSGRLKRSEHEGQTRGRGRSCRDAACLRRRHSQTDRLHLVLQCAAKVETGAGHVDERDVEGGRGRQRRVACGAANGRRQGVSGRRVDG